MSPTTEGEDPELPTSTQGPGEPFDPHLAYADEYMAYLRHVMHQIYDFNRRTDGGGNQLSPETRNLWFERMASPFTFWLEAKLKMNQGVSIEAQLIGRGMGAGAAARLRGVGSLPEPGTGPKPASEKQKSWLKRMKEAGWLHMTDEQIEAVDSPSASEVIDRWLAERNQKTSPTDGSGD